MSTTYYVIISTGSEINRYGSCATWITADRGEGAEHSGWVSETVQATLDESGNITGDLETLLVEQIGQAKAEVERQVGRELEWESTYEDAGLGSIAVASATVES